MDEEGRTRPCSLGGAEWGASGMTDAVTRTGMVSASRSILRRVTEAGCRSALRVGRQGLKNMGVLGGSKEWGRIQR